MVDMMCLSDKRTQIQIRNNVHIKGKGKQKLMLAHGFGCDQNMWRYLMPLLEQDYQLISFDYVGCGKSDHLSFEKQRYSCLEGYAQDVLDICDAYDLEDVVFVGHSISSTIGVIAAEKNSRFISKIVMVCPSPCFLNKPPEYLGGFEWQDIEELINLMDKNYLGWANFFAPLVVGKSNSPAMIKELEHSFCSTEPRFAKPFAKATFFSDYRESFHKLTTPSLIIQSSDDSLASIDIGNYLHQIMRNSSLTIIEAQGHCLHMTQPVAVQNAINTFLKSAPLTQA